MSSRKGSGLTRTRAQKHKNSFAFKNDLHDKTPQQKLINSLNICEVCERCKAQIEWRIKYKKYKPLSQARTCIRCKNRNVIRAYHVCCKECAKKERICAKCLQSADAVNIEPPEPTAQESQQLKVEMDRLIKSLPERKRRTFLRYMKKGTETEATEADANGDINELEEKDADAKKTDAGDISNTKNPKKVTFVPHNRKDLLDKIEALKLADEDYEDDSDFSFSDSDLDDDLDGEDLTDD